MILFLFATIAIVVVFLAITLRPDTSSGHNVVCQVDNLKHFGFRYNGHSISVWPLNNTFDGQIEFHIAGLYYRSDIDNYIGEHEGTLVAENNNPHDSNAIKILAADGHHLGYVPRNFTLDVRKSVKLPCKCYCYIAKYTEKSEVTYFTDCFVPLPRQ